MASPLTFVWTDDRVGLLLLVTLNYKTTKFQKNIDRESCQSKYYDIYHDYLEQYLANGTAYGKGFPHDKSTITKAQVMESGHWSGHGCHLHFLQTLQRNMGWVTSYQRPESQSQKGCLRVQQRRQHSLNFPKFYTIL